MMLHSSGSETLPGRKKRGYIILDRENTIITVWTNFLNEIVTSMMLAIQSFSHNTYSFIDMGYTGEVDCSSGSEMLPAIVTVWTNVLYKMITAMTLDMQRFNNYTYSSQ